MIQMLLFDILYAAHARGTHHKLALRALQALEREDATLWTRLFLKHAETYMRGAKAPDTEFKDFQNHVLHPGGPGEPSWGGAPDAAARWYADTVEAFADGDWETGVFNAGVLTHYLTDPLMPLHTGSSDAETHVHRAMEWSCSRSFESLWREAPDIAPPPGWSAPADGASDWVQGLVEASAKASHVHYGLVIDAYDLDVGVKTPEEGLLPAARSAISGHLAQAVHVVAFALDRAFSDAGVQPPRVSLTAKTVVAGLGMPAKWILKRMDDAAQRSEVQAIYDELQATGGLDAALPEELRAVRRVAARARSAGGARAPSPSRSTPPSSSRPSGRASSRDAAARPRLKRSDPVERAPSIGPKTAAKLETIGVRTVGDLLKADPNGVAERLRDRRIDFRTVAVWRDQAMLLTKIPGLRSSHAMLLVAVGRRSVAAVAEADAETLHRRMSAAFETPEMQRSLRFAEPPSLAAVQTLITRAKGDDSVRAAA